MSWLISVEDGSFSKRPKRRARYSARSLCHSVLVPLSAELGFSIGVTGREPLNNQPYFRMTRLGDDTPVHQGGRAAFTFMLELVGELAKLTTTDAGARDALRAFIAVRRGYIPKYAAKEGETKITPEQLMVAIKALMLDNSEGGKRAQAVVAGLMDVLKHRRMLRRSGMNLRAALHPSSSFKELSRDTAE